MVHPGCGRGQFPAFVCSVCTVSPPCPVCGDPLTGEEVRPCKKCGRTVHVRCGKKGFRGFVCSDDA